MWILQVSESTPDCQKEWKLEIDVKGLESWILLLCQKYPRF